MMLLRSHMYCRRTSFALSSLPPTSEPKSLLSCMAYRLQTTNKSRRLRFGFEEVCLFIKLTSLLRLLLGHPNEATTTRSSCLPNCQRMITFSKIWSLLAGSRPKLWSYLICPRMMSARKQKSWLTTLNGGHRQSVLLPHSRRAPCRFQPTH
jgi:hypothetical protein